MAASRTPPNPPDPAPRRGADASLIRWIMMGVLAWGCVQAMGAWTLNHDWRRPLVVMTCVAGFLGFWLVLLRGRLGRTAGPIGGEDRRAHAAGRDPAGARHAAESP